MNYKDFLSETPFVDEYPHNVVDVHLQDGQVRRLFVNNGRLSGPGPERINRQLDDVVRAYIQDHADVTEARIYRIVGDGDERSHRTITR